MQKISISQINFNQATQDQMDEPQLDEEVVIEKKMNIAMQNHIINDESTQQDPHLTAAYIDFKERLSYKYMITVDTSDFKVMKRKMGMISGNTSPCFYLMTSCLPCYWCGPVFQVPNNQFALVIYRFSTGKKTLIYGPGFHTLYCYSSLQGVYSFSEEYQNNLIESENGDLKIIKVSQGSIAHFECSGQNIILPPGIHLIRDPLIFIENISLDSFFITIGPQRWVTVPDGYDGISIDRGKIKILRGGKQHHLNHAGDKFAKLIPKILQTDKVPSNITQYLVQLENSRFNKDQLSKQNSSDPTFNLMAKTIEGATVFVDAMIFWSIVDTEIAAKTAMEILDKQEQYHTNNQEKAIQDAYYNVQNLRKTVLRIAKNHLCSTISTYSLSSKSEKEHSNLKIDDYNADVKNTFEILQVLQQQDNILKQNINKGKYIKSDLMDVGCYMKAICIYSVRPLEEIQTEIDKQTKTKVDAKTNIIRMQNQQQIQMIDTQTQNEIMIQKAQVDADVILTGANAKAEAKIIKAQCLAEVITTISTARFNEAKELTTTNVAQDLEKIRVIGDAGEKIFTGANNQFVFGQNPGDSIFSLLKGIKK